MTSPPRRPIRRLDPRTVERIAAGEVVERPASVVKELVENALDAGARRVTVRVEAGGADLIEVADDGAGIPAQELELALERHATSKIDPADALERIDTLGFRGEALAAIASVGELTLLSRTDSSPAAEGIRARGEERGDRFTESRSGGTTVRVRELFFNTPARRKFLKAPSAELVEIVRTVERAYLARPSVAFRVESDGREVIALSACDALADAASQVIGREFGASSFDLAGPVPGGSVRGRLGVPSAAVPTSGELYLSVNGRPIASRALAQSVRLGFGDALPRSRYPVGVVHLELDLDRLDVNVHPSKREVRFLRERDLTDALRHLVRDALGRGARSGPPPLASGRPLRGRSPAASAPAPGSVLAGAFGPHPAVPHSVGTLAGPTQRRLDSSAVPARPTELVRSAGHPRLVLLGPVHALYWVAETDDGLVLIDQHAASERYLFDLLRERTPAARQRLVDPISLELTGRERAVLEANAAAVDSAGFEVERFGPAGFRLHAVPTFRGRSAGAPALRDLVRELTDGGRPTIPDSLVDRTVATIACHAAIRAGDVVEPSTISELLRNLERPADRARTCPHGRPIMIHLPRSRLDRWFLRQGV